MTEGDVALTPLPQADGRTKPRPAILLRRMPPFGDWLICGVSTQLHQQVAGFDDIIEASQPDFSTSGLKAPSLIRLGFLSSVAKSQIGGVLGAISAARLRRLRQNLAQSLQISEED